MAAGARGLTSWDAVSLGFPLSLKFYFDQNLKFVGDMMLSGRSHEVFVMFMPRLSLKFYFDQNLKFVGDMALSGSTCMSESARQSGISSLSQILL